MELCRMEGIIPAIESAHALAHVFKMAQGEYKGKTIIMCLSGRGDTYHISAKEIETFCRCQSYSGNGKRHCSNKIKHLCDCNIWNCHNVFLFDIQKRILYRSTDHINWMATKECADVVSQHLHQLFPGFYRCPSDVGRHISIWRRKEFVVMRRRFNAQHVGAISTECAVFQCFANGRFIHKSSTSRI